VSAGGGKPELLAAPHISKVEATYGYPEILPGGRAVLFTIVPNASPGDRNQIAVLDLETRRTRVLIRGGSTPRYAPSGHLVYAAAGSLRAVRFDVHRLEMHGNPVPVVEHVATKGLTGAANFGIARNGTTLVYRTGTAVVGLLHTMVWVDRHGHEEPLGLAPRAYVRADLSPDGTKLALDIRDQENDIWVWDLTRRGPLTPLTFDPGLNRGGLWSPDGRKIVFTAVRDAAENLSWQAADGTGTVERLTHSRRAQLPRAFAPDGTQLLFDEAGDMGAVNLTAIDARRGCCRGRTGKRTARFRRTVGGWRMNRTNPKGPKSTCARFPMSIAVAGRFRPVGARVQRGREADASCSITSLDD
jgi:WD40-like Beta Propeller Repeat